MSRFVFVTIFVFFVRNDPCVEARRLSRACSSFGRILWAFLAGMYVTPIFEAKIPGNTRGLVLATGVSHFAVAIAGRPRQ